jgi:TetR/AcrR family transcriptional regulator, transcriptional repressor for nem operon
MGRPRGFAEAEVLDRALSTFWERGYEATSVQDLVDSTGLSRASLYGAFGDKDALFEKVLCHYRERAAQSAQELESAPSVRQGVGQFLSRTLDAAFPAKGLRGCFFQLAAVEGQADHPAFVGAAREASRSTEQALLKALRQGKKSGELAASLDEKGLARLFTVALHGISASARMGRSREELREVVRQLLTLL